jgi:predicted RNase H-like nuclease (RuvC/YqgF family)
MGGAVRLTVSLRSKDANRMGNEGGALLAEPADVAAEVFEDQTTVLVAGNRRDPGGGGGCTWRRSAFATKTRRMALSICRIDQA